MGVGGQVKRRIVDKDVSCRSHFWTQSEKKPHLMYCFNNLHHFFFIIGEIIYIEALAVELHFTIKMKTDGGRNLVPGFSN